MKRSNCVVACQAALLALLFLAGCGGDEVRRYDISGTVTFQGKPIPEGNIAFEPVEGDIGGGYAFIRDGKFDTSKEGRGHLGGSHRITVNGNTGEPIEPGNPDAGMVQLFPTYEITEDLPESSSMKDIEVPVQN